MQIQYTSFKPKKNTQFLVKSMFFGLSFNVTKFVEHPVETISSQWRRLSTFNRRLLTRATFYKESILSAWKKGTSPTNQKNIVKNLLRLPAMIYLPNIFRDYVKKFPFYFDSLPKILAGIVFSNFEVYCLAPLERLKLKLIAEKSSFSTILRTRIGSNRSNVTKNLFKGLGPTYWITLSGWQTFILLNHYLKIHWKENLGRKQLSTNDLFLISCIVGLASNIMTRPFYYIRNQQNIKPIDKATLSLLANYWSKNGVRAIYSGWYLRFPQSLINITIGVILLEKFETDYKSL